MIDEKFRDRIPGEDRVPKLFSSASLLSVLQEQYRSAVRTFLQACGDFDKRGLINAVVQRASFNCLSIDPRRMSDLITDPVSGNPAFAVPYVGDPFLWYLSPTPVSVEYPLDIPGEVCLPSVMPGDVFGRVCGNEVHILCTEGQPAKCLERIEEAIVYQRQALWITEQALELHLEAMFCPPEWK